MTEITSSINSHVKTTRVPDVVFTSGIFSSRLQNSRFFFLKISKEIGKAWRESRPRASASFQTFCLTARAHLNTQKYGLFCSLIF